MAPKTGTQTTTESVVSKAGLRPGALRKGSRDRDGLPERRKEVEGKG